MKKLLALLLTLTLMIGSLSGITAFAARLETENGVQIEIAPFLYKSTTYQMEFPSHQDYSIKEKSTKNPILNFAITALLLHLLSRPDFVAYDIKMKHNPSVFLCKHLFRIPVFTWTIKSEDVYKNCHKKKLLTIFEGFIPE